MLLFLLGPCTAVRNTLLNVAVLWSHNGILNAHPSCRISQYLRTFIHLSISPWNNLGDTVFDGMGLAGFKSRTKGRFFIGLSSPFLSSTVFHFFSFFRLVLWAWGLSKMSNTLSQHFISDRFKQQQQQQQQQ